MPVSENVYIDCYETRGLTRFAYRRFCWVLPYFCDGKYPKYQVQHTLFMWSIKNRREQMHGIQPNVKSVWSRPIYRLSWYDSAIPGIRPAADDRLRRPLSAISSISAVAVSAAVSYAISSISAVAVSDAIYSISAVSAAVSTTLSIFVRRLIQRGKRKS
jgi:hypothetical protein